MAIPTDICPLCISVYWTKNGLIQSYMYISTTPLQFKCTVYYIYHVWNRGQFGVAYISVWHLPIVGGSGFLSTLYIGTTCSSEDHVTIWGMDGVILHRLCFFYIMYLNKCVHNIYCGQFMLGLFSAIRLPMEADATAAAVDTICLVLSQVLSCSIGFWTFVFGFLLFVYCIFYYLSTLVPIEQWAYCCK